MRRVVSASARAARTLPHSRGTHHLKIDDAEEGGEGDEESHEAPEVHGRTCDFIRHQPALHARRNDDTRPNPVSLEALHGTRGTLPEVKRFELCEVCQPQRVHLARPLRGGRRLIVVRRRTICVLVALLRLPPHSDDGHSRHSGGTAVSSQTAGRGGVSRRSSPDRGKPAEQPDEETHLQGRRGAHYRQWK